MHFNSFEFLFYFLPVTLILYFAIQSLGRHSAAKIFLLLASLFFYGFWDIRFLPLLMASIYVNFQIGNLLSEKKDPVRFYFILGLVLNLGLLIYFKYTNFFIENLNYLSGENFSLLNLTLPLGISFFTFQQIAFLVDSYRGSAKHYKLVDYALFVSFFPQLIMGPIVYYKQLIPQFGNPANQTLVPRNIAAGLFIFAIGLFKKIVIADNLGPYVGEGFSNAENISFIGAWSSSLAFVFQLYFDFSGYTDMAMGVSLMFNIKLPINFYSPLKSRNVAEIWMRWNITLIAFLQRYVYIPLGANRVNRKTTYRNLAVLFLLTGIWHGAGWNFFVWGLIQAVASIVHHEWRSAGLKMPGYAGFLATFIFMNIVSMIFRVNEPMHIVYFLQGMVGLNGFTDTSQLADIFYELNGDLLFTIVFLLAICITFLPKYNSVQLLDRFALNATTGYFTAIVFIIAILADFSGSEDFIYFQF